MGTTPTYGFPYPELTDAPDGPAQIKALATAVENSVKAGMPMVQTLLDNVTVTAATQFSKTYTFAKAFPAQPSVTANIDSQSSNVLNWITRCASISTTSFLLLLTGPTATYNFWVNWTAALQPTAGTGTKNPPESRIASEGWHTVTGTCHTPGCPNEDVAITGIWVPDVPEDWGWTGVMCGGCRQPITDLTPEP